tara:strand:- start:51 stop:290 length:240 start_codon:yes stop_codon:yes gene_type:complete
MISTQVKNIFYQLSMISFLAVTFAKTKFHLHLFLIIAYSLLMIWEYSLNKSITIDALFWALLFIGINIYRIYESSEELK